MIALWLLSILIRIALITVTSARHASPLIAGGDLLFMLGLAADTHTSRGGQLSWLAHAPVATPGAMVRL